MTVQEIYHHRAPKVWSKATSSILGEFKDGFNYVAKIGCAARVAKEGRNRMAAWREKALEIGKTLQEAGKTNPELAPLYTSWMNFARKHHLHRQTDDADALRALLERNGLTIIAKRDVDQLKETITSQDEEIKAQEHRISTLMRS